MIVYDVCVLCPCLIINLIFLKKNQKQKRQPKFNGRAPGKGCVMDTLHSHLNHSCILFVSSGSNSSIKRRKQLYLFWF